VTVNPQVPGSSPGRGATQQSSGGYDYLSHERSKICTYPMFLTKQVFEYKIYLDDIVLLLTIKLLETNSY